MERIIGYLASLALARDGNQCTYCCVAEDLRVVLLFPPRMSLDRSTGKRMRDPVSLGHVTTLCPTCEKRTDEELQRREAEQPKSRKREPGEKLFEERWFQQKAGSRRR